MVLRALALLAVAIAGPAVEDFPQLEAAPQETVGEAAASRRRSNRRLTFGAAGASAGCIEDRKADESIRRRTASMAFSLGIIKTVAEAAREYGVNRQSLAYWRKADKASSRLHAACGSVVGAASLGCAFTPCAPVCP